MLLGWFIASFASTPLKKVQKPAMVIVIDNYDSFTYNLVQRLGEIDPNIEIQVHRNDGISLSEIERESTTAAPYLARPLHPYRSGY